MKEPKPMREIHEIQEKIYEKEKKMSEPARLENIHQRANRLIQKYRLVFKGKSKAA